MEKTDQYLEEKFKEYNAKYFDSKLEPIKVRWCASSNKFGSFDYILNAFICKADPLEISISGYLVHDDEVLRNILVHEMLHYYCHCVIGYPKEVWMEALKIDPRLKKASAKKLLCSTDLTCHSGAWAEGAKKLNEMYPELHISRRGAVTQRSIDQMNSENSALQSAVACTLKVNGKLRRFVLTADAFETLKADAKRLVDRDVSCELKVFTLDKAKFAECGARVLDDTSHSYAPAFWAQMKRDGVISNTGKTLKEAYDFLREEGFSIIKERSINERKDRRCVWTEAELEELGITEEDLAECEDEIVEIS